MHRLLVPLDGSALAEAVLPTAIELGTALAADWILVRVVAPPPSAWAAASPDWGPVAVWEAEELGTQDAQRAAQDYLEEVRRRMPFPERVTVETPAGPVLTALIKAAADQQATLMAMSTHGRGGLNRLVMGSVTDMVIRLSSVPVVVVRPSVVG